MRSFYVRCLIACANVILTCSPGVAQNAPAPATVPAPVIYNGIDVAPFIEFAKSDLRKVTVPFKIYHWDQGGQRDYWKTITTGHFPGFAKALQASATIPFRALGNPGGSANMYGAGFYTSLDPVATRTYGGYDYITNHSAATTNQVWQLTEITVPPGVVFLELSDAHSFSSSKIDLSTILSTFGCTARTADDFFKEGGASLTPACVGFVKFIYQKTLQIDLFSYFYSTTSFLTCKQGLSKLNADSDRAMVLTNGRWITPSSVFTMHAASTEDLETRRLIQTLFLYNGYASSMGQRLDPGAAKSVIVRLLTANPTYVIQGGPVTCTSSQCDMTVYACPAGVHPSQTEKSCKSDSVTLPVPKSAVMHNADFSPYGLLWPDLEGQPKATPEQVDDYLNSNRLGCDGKERYVNVPTDAVKEGQ